MSAPGLGDVEVTLTVPGGPVRRLIPELGSARWTTAAVGGFGSFSCQLPGRPFNRPPHLAKITIALGQRILFEGLVEDVDYLPADEATEIQAFGYRREIDNEAVQDVWKDVQLDWQPRKLGAGIVSTAHASTTFSNRNVFSVNIGVVDDSDLTIRGLRFSATGIDLSFEDSTQMVAKIPDGIEIHNFTTDFETTAEAISQEGILAYGVAGVSLTVDSEVTSDQSVGIQPPAGTNRIYLAVGVYLNPVSAPDAGDYMQFTNMRFLGIKDEDSDGNGFNGGTLIRDLIGYIPTLTQGRIDDGDEFLIDVFAAWYPTPARQLFDQVTSLYTKELAVWENGRVDWTEPQLDEPHWVCTTADLLPGSRVRASVDETVRKTILVYQDATIENETDFVEQSGGGQHNPYVRHDRPKTEIINPGFPLTPTTAAQLAEKLNNARNERPAVSGRVSLPARLPIRHVQSGLMPAWAIRAGENLLISDMPKTEPFQTGRDGETLFHIISADVDLDANTVTLELDAQVHRADVLLARLAAVTRNVTG